MNKDVLTKTHTYAFLMYYFTWLKMVNFLRLKSATTREDDKKNENNGE